MRYDFPSPVPLLQASAVQIKRMDVNWIEQRVLIYLDVLRPTTLQIAQSRSLEFTVAQLDSVLTQPGATLEEKILRGIVAFSAEIPDGGTFVP